MDQLVGFLLHPPHSEIGKKIGKMLKYNPTFKVLSVVYITPNEHTFNFRRSNLWRLFDRSV